MTLISKHSVMYHIIPQMAFVSRVPHLHLPNLPISISQGNPQPSLVSDRINFIFCKPYSSRWIMYLRELSRSLEHSVSNIRRNSITHIP